jgi:hypothetical protein
MEKKKYFPTKSRKVRCRFLSGANIGRYNGVRLYTNHLPKILNDIGEDSESGHVCC